jgi:hypothetical protein
MNGLLIFFIYLFDNFCVNIEVYLLGLSDGEDYQWHRRFLIENFSRNSYFSRKAKTVKNLNFQRFDQNIVS